MEPAVAEQSYAEHYAADLYGAHYAEVYDALWQENPHWSAEAGHYLESFRQVLRPDSRWLDVGCGTGWFLSRFPGIDRAGIDISPAMLERARAANPDVQIFREGDIRDDVPEWHDSWDLVSSTGQAWGYVDGIAEIATIAENMARWTKPTGTLMVQPPGIVDLTGLDFPEHFDVEAPLHDPVAITAVIWSFRDHAGLHANQIWPSFDTWVRLLRQWFARIEIVTWPHDPPHLAKPRRLILASRKRVDGDDSETEIVHRSLHPDEHPDGLFVPAAGPCIEPDDAGSASDAPSPDPATSTDVPGGGGVTAVAGPELPPPGTRLPGRRLVDQPLSYLLSRLRPTEVRFWRSGLRRVVGKLR